MKQVPLYKYTREDGGVTVSLTQPEGEYTEMIRLVADEGKLVTQNGEELFYCLDVNTAEEWYEIDAPEEEEKEWDS